MNQAFFTNVQFIEMMVRQRDLNEKFVPDFMTNVSLEQYAIALINEVSEFLESTPRFHNHKFWKPYQNDDIQNSIVEIVDIIHFGLSCLLVLNEGVFTIEQYDVLNRKNRHCDDFLSVYSQIVASCSNQKNKIAFFYAFKSLVCQLCSYHRLTFDKIYDVYMQKLELNSERVDGGYTKGEYEKVKNGEEDNRRIVT